MYGYKVPYLLRCLLTYIGSYVPWVRGDSRASGRGKGRVLDPGE
jgi:hypothetical protein